MNDRRRFLKSAVGGALLLGLPSRSAVAALKCFAQPGEVQDRFTRHVDLGKSRVVIARDAGLHSASGGVSEQRVVDLLDRAMAAYTGRDRVMEAWRRILPQGAADSVVGLKINGCDGKGIATHAALVLAVAQRLRQAGVKPGNILVWDRNAEGVEACGLSMSDNPAHLRCAGADQVGYEERPVADEPITYGAAANARLAKILTRQCDLVIGLPILRDHSTAGISFALMNMDGAVAHPQELDADGCNPGVADLNLVPAIRHKVCFTIGDAITSIYDGGPQFNSAHLWQSNALVVAKDRVAADFIAWQLIDSKRAQAGLPSLESAGRAPHYIATAGDSAHNLGFNNPDRIDLVNV
jgi:uncharacterized protein (DUF362 family)